MKLNKIFSGIMALLMGAAMLTACSDKDDYSANTGTRCHADRLQRQR